MTASTTTLQAWVRHVRKAESYCEQKAMQYRPGAHSVCAHELIHHPVIPNVLSYAMALEHVRNLSYACTYTHLAFKFVCSHVFVYDKHCSISAGLMMLLLVSLLLAEHIAPVTIFYAGVCRRSSGDGEFHCESAVRNTLLATRIFVVHVYNVLVTHPLTIDFVQGFPPLRKIRNVIHLRIVALSVPNVSAHPPVVDTWSESQT